MLDEQGFLVATLCTPLTRDLVHAVWSGPSIMPKKSIPSNSDSACSDEIHSRMTLWQICVWALSEYHYYLLLDLLIKRRILVQCSLKKFSYAGKMKEFDCLTRNEFKSKLLAVSYDLCFSKLSNMG